jgi:hypothetical protein
VKDDPKIIFIIIYRLKAHAQKTATTHIVLSTLEGLSKKINTTFCNYPTPVVFETGACWGQKGVPITKKVVKEITFLP